MPQSASEISANPPSVPKLAKALWGVAGALTTIAVAIFGAGVYWAQMTADLKNYKNKIDTLVKDVATLKEQNDTSKRNLNAQFGRLVSIENNPAPYKNDSHSGAGNVADRPPGRCQPNEVVVGLQPLQNGTGIVMQCGRIPLLKLD